MSEPSSVPWRSRESTVPPSTWRERPPPDLGAATPPFEPSEHNRAIRLMIFIPAYVSPALFSECDTINLS